MKTNYKQFLVNAIFEYEGSIDDLKAKKMVAVLNGNETTKTRLLTTRQAAEYLNIHPVTMRILGQKGIIKPIRYSSRKLRWPENLLAEYLYHGQEV